MTQIVKSPAANGGRASNDALLLGGFEHSETSPNTVPPQRRTEACELEAFVRRPALAALCLSGALALQQAALGSHYARRAVVLIREAGR